MELTNEILKGRRAVYIYWHHLNSRPKVRMSKDATFLGLTKSGKAKIKVDGNKRPSYVELNQVVIMPLEG